MTTGVITTEEILKEQDGKKFRYIHINPKEGNHEKGEIRMDGDESGECLIDKVDED